MWSGVSALGAVLTALQEHYWESAIFSGLAVLFIGQGINWFRKYIVDHK